MAEQPESYTDAHFSDEEMRATAAEAEMELGELAAQRGLEYLYEEPRPGEERAGDRFAQLADEYNYVASSAPEAATAHIHYGKQFIICGMYEQAATALERAIQLRPESADAHCLYARALVGLGRDDEARAHYAEACRRDVRLFESRFELEMLRVRAGVRPGLAEGYAGN